VVIDNIISLRDIFVVYKEVNVGKILGRKYGEV